jgi:hypothetical protein
MTTEYQKIDRLAEFIGLDKAPPYFQPFHDWNHTHIVLDKVMGDETLWEEFYNNFVWICEPRASIRDYMKATKQELMDTVYDLLTNS